MLIDAFTLWVEQLLKVGFLIQFLLKAFLNYVFHVHGPLRPP